MNKFVIALCFTLAIASAQDCSSDFYAALPALQKMYMDYNAKNWAAVEGDIERFIPTAKDMLAHCANVTLPDTPALNACIEDGKAIARLVVPLIVDSSNQTALMNLMVQLPGLASHIYSTCIKPTNTLELFQEDFDTEAFSLNFVKGFAQCAGNITAMFPDMKDLVEDLANNAPIQVISEDIMTILGHTNNVCDACGLPRPEAHIAQGDIEECLNGAEKIGEMVHDVLASKGNIPVALTKLAALAEFLPTVAAQCTF